MAEKHFLCSHFKIEKYDANGVLFEVVEFDDNVFLNSGINAIWTAVCGGTFTAFNSTNARIGVGDSDTAASATQTDLQGTNKTYKGMDSGYPSYGSDQKVVFKATFGSDDANYAWKEFVIKNNSSGICIDRKVSSQGTKASGQTWVPTITLTIT